MCLGAQGQEGLVPPPCWMHVCRFFSASDMVARKRVKPWSLVEHTMGVKFVDIHRLYSETANAPGLVHAVAGPVLDGDRYDVSLAPLGREGQYERFNNEKAVQRMAHGLLHGLAAIHEVGLVIMWVLIAYHSLCMTRRSDGHFIFTKCTRGRKQLCGLPLKFSCRWCE